MDPRLLNNAVNTKISAFEKANHFELLNSLITQLRLVQSNLIKTLNTSNGTLANQKFVIINAIIEIIDLAIAEYNERTQEEDTRPGGKDALQFRCIMRMLIGISKILTKHYANNDIEKSTIDMHKLTHDCPTKSAFRLHFFSPDEGKQYYYIKSLILDDKDSDQLLSITNLINNINALKSHRSINPLNIAFYPKSYSLLNDFNQELHKLATSLSITIERDPNNQAIPYAIAHDVIISNYKPKQCQSNQFRW